MSRAAMRRRCSALHVYSRRVDDRAMQTLRDENVCSNSVFVEGKTYPARSVGKVESERLIIGPGETFLAHLPIIV
jgi:hypothetical protein